MGHNYRQVRDVLRAVRTDPTHRVRADLDQCPATVATVLRRLDILGRRPSDILVLGDDDLLGLALASTGARRRIVVLDADPLLLARIRRCAPPDALEFVVRDLRQGLPRALHQRFDEVFTDPPYTLAGQLFFVHSALTALRSGVGASLYVCASRAYMTARNLALVRRFLQRAGFELERADPGFSRYKAPPDVRRDLKAAGRQSTAWLESDLFHYARHRVAPVPTIPRRLKDAIYEYQT